MMRHLQMRLLDPAAGSPGFLDASFFLGTGVGVFLMAADLATAPRVSEIDSEYSLPAPQC